MADGDGDPAGIPRRRRDRLRRTGRVARAAALGAARRLVGGTSAAQDRDWGEQLVAELD